MKETQMNTNVRVVYQRSTRGLQGGILGIWNGSKFISHQFDIDSFLVATIGALRNRFPGTVIGKPDVRPDGILEYRGCYISDDLTRHARMISLVR